MIELKAVSKSYKTGDFEQVALDQVSLSFRESEFVSILGPSGSGKTTLLNILGGLDRYDEGDLIINSRSTKDFKDRDWDAYRNNSVGFVFQSYNLIPHLSVIDNVEMGMTLSGVKKKEKREKAMNVLKKVGLENHVYKKPSQLSGGQMQRVAIARALSNDPDIILADEPTGALDSDTSVQILDLIREISKDKLVIMVTHNEELATNYSDRIISFRDGRVVDDSRPVVKELEKTDYRLEKTSMGFFTALKLSGKNIFAKKWRTLLTSFASSIGIIGIALILSLSNGFSKEIEAYERDTLSGFPIMITEEAQEFDIESIKEQRGEDNNKKKKKDGIYPYDVEDNIKTHKNKLSNEFIDYLADMDEDMVSGLSLNRLTDINLLGNTDGSVSKLDTNKLSFQPYPSYHGSLDYLRENYSLVKGGYPKKDTDLLMLVDSDNRIDAKLVRELGLDSKDKLDFDSILGHELRYAYNDDYYMDEGGYFRMKTGDDLEAVYNNGIGLEIVGIIRPKDDKDLGNFNPGIMYSDKIYRDFIESSKTSKIVKAQEDKDYNLLTGEKFVSDDKLDEKDLLLLRLGGKDRPVVINIYPRNFDSKDRVIDYLKAWNKGKKNEDTIVYTDLAASFTELTGEIMGGITLVLVAFASISLVVSLIMVGIITYISVLERRKEIGVLRALGARSKDITRVFDAETFIIGAVSGSLAIAISYAIIPSINRLLEGLTDLENIAKLDPRHALGLVLISITLTLLGGFIPAKMAAKEDPVRALSDE